MSTVEIPFALGKTLSKTGDGQLWLDKLPDVVATLTKEWNLQLSRSCFEDVTGSWVAPCESAYGQAVLKVGFPHYEADYEIDGLLAWNGGCTVRLLKADRANNALLLERCEPGTSLRNTEAAEQDSVITELLKELWLTPAPHHVQSLDYMIGRWCTSARLRYAKLRESGEELDFALAKRGLAELKRLASDHVEQKLLATDLHAGNVLASSRRPWLVIDPKPHVGDACYDLTQHLMNIKPRIDSEGPDLTERLAALANVDPDRLLRWTFGRLCLNPENLPLARKLATNL